LLTKAKRAAGDEAFDKADKLLKQAKRYGRKSDAVENTRRYILAKKQARDERLERQRQARLAAQQHTSSGGHSYRRRVAISLCNPGIPRPGESSQCSGARTASGKYATIELKRRKGMFSSSADSCFTVTIYGGSSFGLGNTCSGVNDYWAVRADGASGYVKGLGNAIAWMLRRM